MALVAVGCGDSKATVELRFERPSDGDVLDASADIDPAIPGVQIEVEIATQSLAEDDVVGLLQNDQMVGEQPGAPSIIFEVTLRRGTNVFQIVFDGEPLQSIEVEFSDPCGSVSFTQPQAPSDGEDLVLGGDFCGGDQTVDVVAAVPDADDGTAVTLVVNGSVAGEASVATGVVRFDDVTFGRRDRGNEMALRIASDDGGEACELVAFPASIVVDCEGPSCEFTAPVVGPGETLTAADDISDEPGLQIDVEVTTDASASGRPTTLIINGNRDLARTATAGTSGSDVVASFSEVTLSDGSQSVRAECVDEIGNVSAATAQWNVDTEPCKVSVVSVTPDPGDDGTIVAPSVGASVDATLRVAVTGDDCTELRAVVDSSDSCGDVAAQSPVDIAAGDAAEFDLPLTLDSGGPRFLCAEVRDASGNTAIASTPITFSNGAPSLTLSLPSGGPTAANYNKEGTAGRIADLRPNSPSCDAAFVVDCIGPQGEDLTGTPVEIFLDGAGTPPALQAATCQNGRAVFDLASSTLVALPSRDDGTSYDIRARASFEGLQGVSDTVAVTADCRAPSIRLSDDNVCGQVIRSEADVSGDEDIQFPLTVVNLNSPQRAVEVVVLTSGAREEVSRQSSTIHQGGGLTLFNTDNPVDFGDGGDLIVQACTDDTAGNVACAECETTVGDVPRVAITAPTPRQVLTTDLGGDYRGNSAPADGSCAGSADFNIRIQATADGATAGADAATVTVGSLPPVTVAVDDAGTVDDDSDNFVDACVPATGTDGENVRIVLQTSNEDGAVSTPITVSIDTAAPPVLEDAIAESQCRAAPGLAWASQADTDNTLVAYEVRCAETDITSSAEWFAADVVVDSTDTPSAMISTLNPGDSVFCAVRSFDVAGAYSPLGAAVGVQAEDLDILALSDFPAFPQGGFPIGAAPFPVGDVNGDGLADFVVAGGIFGKERVFLFFGQKLRPEGDGDPVPPQPSPIELTGPTSTGFGWMVRPIGNFDNDSGGDNASGTTDFAIGSQFDPDGIVYVVLGRASDQWPSGPVQLDAGECSADLCIAGDPEYEGTAVNFGYQLGSAGSFNSDDAIPDLAIGGRVGQPVVVLGDEYPLANLGMAGSGLCVDARSEGATGSAACDTNGDAAGGSELANGFRIFHPASAPITGAAGGLVSVDRNDLWFVTAGSQASENMLFYVAGQSYPFPDNAAEPLPGLVDVDLVGKPISEGGSIVGLVPNTSVVDHLVVLGDYNGDTLDDIGLASRNQVVQVLYGTTDDSGRYMLSIDRRQHANNGQPEAGTAWGQRLSPGYVQGLGSVSLVNGDDASELFLSSGGIAASSVEGRADLSWGPDGQSTPASPVSTTRSALLDVGFDKSTPGAPQDDPTRFPRFIAPIGDFDGDGRHDVVVVEDDTATVDNPDTVENESRSRLLVVGTCM